MKLLIGVPTTAHTELAQYEIEGLRELGVEIETVPYGSRKEKESWPKKVWLVFRTIFRFRSAMKKAKYDLVYLNSALASRALLRDVATTIGLWSTNVPIFIKMHGSEITLLQRNDFLIRTLRRILFNRASAFGLLSNEEVKNFKDAGAEERKLFRVKNIVNPNVYQKQIGFKESIGLDGQTPMLLFVSRFIASKGLIDLINACGIVRDRGYVIDLVCLGDGPELARCKQAVDDLELQERVHFLGFLPEADTKAFYASAAMAILPTWHDEGFPMAVFQAVAAGVPVITTRIRAAADYLIEPDNCLWVEPRNATMLAVKIQILLDDPGLASQMGRNNAASAVNYSKETVSRDLVAAFQQVKNVLTDEVPTAY